MLTMVVWFNVFKYGLSGILLFIDSLVYWGVAKAFALFYALANVSSTVISQDTYQEIANKFYVIIGVVMLFYLTYSLLKSLINPDDFNKNVGKIASNLIVSLILLGVVPLLFSYAFEIQGAVLNDHVIEKVITGVSGMTVSADDSNQVQGNKASYLVLRSFLNKEEENLSGETMTWNYFMSEVESGNTEIFLDITDFAEVVHAGDMYYLSIFSTICGAFLLYVIISFSLDLGIRIAKLAFYEIIAPIPVLMRILPEKKSVFDNWVKGTIATFMEVFIRIFIMSIIVFFASEVLNNVDLFGSNIGLIGNVVIVLGLFAFAKQAPKLLGDVMGLDSGNIKLGIGGKLKGSGVAGAAVLGAAGALTGGLGGMHTSLANGAGLSGFFNGAVNGWKGKGMQYGKQRQKLYADYGLKGKAGFFGGRSYLDQKIDDTKKKNINDKYLQGQKNRLSRMENSEEYQGYYNKYLHEEERTNRDKLNAANDKYLDALASYNNRKDKIEEFEKSAEYQGILSSVQNRAIIDAENEMKQAVLDKKYAATPEGRAQYQADKEALINSLQSKYALEQLTQNASINALSDDAKIYLDSLNSVDASKQAMLDASQNLQTVSNSLSIDTKEIEKKAREDMKNSTTKLGQKYKVTSENVSNKVKQKELQDYLKSDEGRRQIAINEEVLKSMRDNTSSSTPPSAGSGDSSGKK